MLIKEEGPNQFGNKIFTFSTNHVLEVPGYYKVTEFIGCGSYGIVCSAVDTTTGQSVAIKKISNIFESESECKRILREIKIMGFMNHPNILKITNIFTPNNSKNFTDLYLVLPLMKQDMKSLLQATQKRLAAGHCQYFTLQLLFALRYMHSANILHRDLKPSNLLIDEDLNLKLCDFGLARELDEEMTSYVVTRWYRAPELLLGYQKYDYAVDLWSVGCLAVEMVTGKPLFRGNNYIHQLSLIANLLGTPDMVDELPGATPEASEYMAKLQYHAKSSLEYVLPNLRSRFDEVSFFDSFEKGEEEENSAMNKHAMSPSEYYQQLEDFVSALLKYNPAARLTASEAIMHPWLSEMRGDVTKWEAFKTSVPFQLNHMGYDHFSMDQISKLFLEEIVKFDSINKDYGKG